MRRRPSLFDLCRVYGVQPYYRDVFGKVRKSPTGSLIKVLKSLGARLEGLSDIASAYQDRLDQLNSGLIEPVITLFEGDSLLPLNLRKCSVDKVVCRLRLENETKIKKWVIRSRGQYIGASVLRVPFSIPYGYHKLEVEVVDSTFSSLIISAPSKAYRLKDRVWGLFIPLYSLHAKTSWGAGTYTDLMKLVNWASKVGAAFVGTIPLLPFPYSSHFDPSPYSPSTKLFWSDFYVDLNSITNLDTLNDALKDKLRKVTTSKQVEYEDIIELKTRVAEVCKKTLNNREGRLARYLREHPELKEYAEFKAAKQASNKEEYEEKTRVYLYLQALAHLQFEDLINYAEKKGVKLYLDLPLGCNPDGYDAIRFGSIIVKDVFVGAPPDFFFPKGQNWGINPLHPEKIREDRYGYYIQSIRHHMRHAGYLRLDHIMALHRLYWIPRGAGSDEGVYVKYRAEEFYAIINLESYRHKCVVVGENLGTVPSYVNKAIRRHGIFGCYILQLKPPSTLQRITQNTLAALNTHDMPSFKAYLRGVDIKLRLRMGLIDLEQAAEEIKWRRHQIKVLRRCLKDYGLLKEERSIRDLLVASLRLLALSRAKMLLISLEDLWLEEAIHNIPGTGTEVGNWRHKSKLSLERFTIDKEVLRLLNLVNEARRSNPYPSNINQQG